MKAVLLITSSFPQNFNGEEAAGTFVYDYCLELSKYVDLHVLYPGGEAGSKVLGRNFTVHSFSPIDKPLSLLKLYNPLDAIKIAKILWQGRRITIQLERQYEFDRAFCLWALPSAYWAKAAGIEYDTWALGSDIWSLGKIPVVRSVLKNVLMHSSRLYADGLKLAEDVRAIAQRECEFLPSSRRLTNTRESLRASKKKVNLAFLGRWHPNKGVDILTAALAMLTDSDWSMIAEVRLAGGGPLESEVLSAVASLGAQGRPVSCYGFMNKNEAASLFEWADWFLLPSRIESIPVVFSDCMQFNLPLVAMPVGDIPLLMEEYNVGVCAGDISASGFCEALQRALYGYEVDKESFNVCAQDFSVTRSVERILKGVL